MSEADAKSAEEAAPAKVEKPALVLRVELFSTKPAIISVAEKNGKLSGRLLRSARRGLMKWYGTTIRTLAKAKTPAELEQQAEAKAQAILDARIAENQKSDRLMRDPSRAAVKRLVTLHKQGLLVEKEAASA